MSIKDIYEMSIINTLFRMHQMKKAEKMSPKEIEALQEQRFKKLLRYVVKNSEFYRDYYKSHGINLEKIDEIKLEDLPTIDKQIMMDNYDQLVCDKSLKRRELEEFIADSNTLRKKYSGKYQITHTSGSSGRIGIFAYGPNDWSIMKALVITRVSKTKLHLFKKIKTAFIGVIDGNYGGISLISDVPKMLFDFLAVDINKPISESVSALNRHMPESLSGYSSAIYIFALEQLKGNLRIKPERIICSADALTENMADKIYEAFGVKPINFYAATESIGMAVQCDEEYSSLHLFNDWHVFEVVSEDGKPAEPGEPGSLILTNLYNYSQPLIRYKMDDQLIIDKNKCSCDSPFPVVSKIAGRDSEIIAFEAPDGTKPSIHPSVFEEFMVVGLEMLQVVEVYKNKLNLIAVVHGDKEAVKSNIKNRMDEILITNNLIDFVKYKIIITDDIPSDPQTGKFKIVIPLKK